MFKYVPVFASDFVSVSLLRVAKVILAVFILNTVFKSIFGRMVFGFMVCWSFVSWGRFMVGGSGFVSGSRFMVGGGWFMIHWCRFIDVALYTITKSTSIVFILMFSLLFKLEKKHWSLIVIVLMISAGLAMFTYKSTEFVLAGFLMVLSASFLSGRLS